MGDFYEMFGEDAERASAPARPGADDPRQGAERRPDGGVPPPGAGVATWPSSSRPVSGRRSASRSRTRSSPRGWSSREVVRVVTPGTLTDEALLDPRAANYLAAVVEAGGKLGLAWVELSTGRFSLTGVSRTELADEVARLNPAETLVSETAPRRPLAPRPPRPVRGWRSPPGRRGTSRPSRPATTLFDHFKTATLAGFGVDDHAPEVQAAGALIAYLRETQKSSIGHITRLTPYRRAETLALDEMTRRSLELTRTLREGKRDGSLLAVIDRTVHPDGRPGSWPTG